MPWSASFRWKGARDRLRGRCRWPFRRRGRKGCGLVVPTESAGEAAVVEDIEVIPVASLGEAAAFFAGQLEVEPFPSRLDQLFQQYARYEDDFADVRGQEMAKRALTIAAAGGHNLLMVGSARFGEDDAGQACADDHADADGGRVDRDDAHI